MRLPNLLHCHSSVFLLGMGIGNILFGNIICGGASEVWAIALVVDYGGNFFGKDYMVRG